MYNNVEELKKHPVFKYFSEISKIPRSSGNEQEISDYLVRFAQTRNLKVIQDDVLNVIIKKPASVGYENAPTVILQGHMDMVCEKNKETVHDFTKDPIKLRIIDDMMYATNTTLGADDGIALAFVLALLDSDDIPHPQLEILLTTEEEITFKGALAVNPDYFQGKILINLDSEDGGTLLVSSAGGSGAKQILPITWEELQNDLLPYRISIRGLKGGHSGMAIDKGRGNANKLMGRILKSMLDEFPYYIREINGGVKRNAIPREADAVILVHSDYIDTLENKINQFNDIFKNELKSSDSEVNIKYEKIEDNYTTVFSLDTMRKAINSLILIPNGIQSMSMDVEGLVESSTNLGIVMTGDKEILFENEIRSSIKSLKEYILMQLKMVSDILECEFVSYADYPEWSYDPDSKIRILSEKIYNEKYGKYPKITACHAGIECSSLMERILGLDAISIGPDIYDVHNPNEHLSISSTIKTWEYFLELLKEIK